jgi:hypothetical protein
VEEITKGDGKVISRSREQVIQSLEIRHPQRRDFCCGCAMALT